jgi:beta-lactamase regulating signal transducer with metallopeptidase domain
MTTHWLDQFAVVSIGLTVAALAALPARRLLRHDPRSCHRLSLALLIGSLALLPLQWIVQGVAHEELPALRRTLARWFEPAAEPAPRSPEISPRAPLADDSREPFDADEFKTVLASSDDAPLDGAENRADGDAAHFALDLRLPSDSPAAPSSVQPPAPVELGAFAPRPTTAPRAPRVVRASTTPKARLAATPAAAADAAESAGPAESGRPAAWREVLAPVTATLRGPAGLALWALGLFAIVLRRAIGLLRTIGLVRAARPLDDADVLATWREVARDSPLRDRVELLATERLASPACVGGWRPKLLVPLSRGRTATPDAMAWALRHELVHLERGDAVYALLQSAATALFWFHPAAWWLSAEVGRWRELSCDQVVVEQCGRRRSYARALLDYATAVFERNDSATDAGPHSAGVRCALLHWSRSPSQIQRRIEMLTVDVRPPSGPRRALGGLFALAAFVVPAFGQVAASATLLPKDGGAAPLAPAALPPVQAAPAAAPTAPAPLPPRATPVAAPQEAPAPEVVPVPAEPPAVAPPCVDDDKVADDAAAHARAARADQLRAELAESRARRANARADEAARRAQLAKKLEDARQQGDDDAADAIEQEVDRLEEQRDAADDVCDATCDQLEAELDAMGDQGDSCAMAVAGEDVVADDDGRVAKLGVDATRKAFAQAQEQLAVAMKQLADGADQPDARRMLAQQKEALAQAQKCLEQAMRALEKSGARQHRFTVVQSWPSVKGGDGVVAVKLKDLERLKGLEKFKSPKGVPSLDDRAKLELEALAAKKRGAAGVGDNCCTDDDLAVKVKTLVAKKQADAEQVRERAVARAARVPPRPTAPQPPATAPTPDVPGRPAFPRASVPSGADARAMEERMAQLEREIDRLHAELMEMRKQAADHTDAAPRRERSRKADEPRMELPQMR